MSMDKIAEVIKNNESFAVVVHMNPDGDCLGSAAALVSAIRNMGKTAYVFVDGVIPEKLSFVCPDEFVGKSFGEPEVCIAVDVADINMMGCMKEKVFEKASVTCCLDHHGTNRGYAQFNYVDGGAAAAGEIIYYFIRNYLQCDITADMAKCIYTAIASDTGSFKYSNTTSKTHRIASELLEFDFNAPAVMRILFDEQTIEHLRLENEVVSKLKFYNDNKICIALVDKVLLDKYGMTFEQVNDLASLPRTISGVEVGVFMKVKGSCEIKVSLRSNEYVDVAAVASVLGGGGHKRAAGVTVKKPVYEAEEIIINELLKVM